VLARRPAREPGHAVAPEDRADGRAADAVAQLDELAVYTQVAPGGVLVGEAQDERLEVAADGWSPAGAATAEGPLAADQLPVPLEHHLRREEHKAPPPRRAGAAGVPLQGGGHDREGELLPARGAHAAGLGALQDAELVPQEEDLEVSLARVASCEGGEIEQPGEQRRQQAVDHETGRSFPDRRRARQVERGTCRTAPG
jgi:hypothetical protein